MSDGAEPRERELALEELRTALNGLLGAQRRLRSREGRLPGGVGLSQQRILGALRREAQLSASALALAADLAAPTVTEMLDSLTTAGLVERHRDGPDRRVVLVSLTALGRREYDAKHALVLAAWKRELADLDNGALDGATAVLGRLATFLDSL